MKTILLSIFCFLTVIHSDAIADEKWKLEKDKDEIKIWTKKLDNSNLKECRMIATVNSSMDKVLSVFSNYKYFDKIMYKIKPGSVKMVKKISDDNFYVYMIATAPLVKDRDLVIHFTFNRNQPNGAVWVNIDANDWNLIPEKDDCVRITNMKGFYRFTPLKNGKVEIYHQSYSYPGGGIPEGLANFVVTDAPYSLMVKLRNLVN